MSHSEGRNQAGNANKPYEPQGGVAAGTSYIEGGARRGDKVMPSQLIGQRSETAIDKAMGVLEADKGHRSLAADQILMFRTIMPGWQAGMRQLSEGLFKWFRHQGFWRADHEPWGVKGGADGTVTISTDEYIRLKKSEKIALIHSELSEMLEAVRKKDFDNEGEEWADTLVRLLDYNGGFGIAGETAFEHKGYENYQRPYRHNKEF